ncbi:MAG: hypothetical protein ACNI3A_02835 [Desulfovibrio sp.]|uniref:hypothetical protein n=1 Tax=Desulfovibrio sp. 7SRBS1 TaxID=3378064 RepID=UPI003B41417F
MIMINENGLAKVPGVGNLPIPNLSPRELDMEQPAEPHGLGNIGNALGLPRLDMRLKSILSRDNAHSIKSRSRHYDRIAKIAIDPLGTAIANARRIAKNTDLKDEIRARRAAEAIEGAWPEAQKELDAIQGELSKAVNFAEAVYREVWTRPEDTDPHLQELRDREVRDVLRSMEDNKRIVAIMDAARAGRLDLFRILEADPLGQLATSFPSDTMDRARALVLDKAGFGWGQALRDDAKADSEHLAAMVRLLKDGIAAELTSSFGARFNNTPKQPRLLKAA